MNEWMSFFGPIPDILEPVTEEEPPPSKIPADSPYWEMNNYLELFLKDEKGSSFHCSEEALRIIQTSLDLALTSIIEDCDKESVQRAKCDNRVLVPALLNSVAHQNPYLQFISNAGLQKPDNV